MHIAFAQQQDMNSWMDLLHLVQDSFPGLNMREYQTGLAQCMDDRQALVAKVDNTLGGALIFSKDAELTFLAVHPQHRHKGIGKALIQACMSQFPPGTRLSVVTYRDGDPLGVAARKLYQSLGFCDGELLTVFDYPCQELYTIIQ